MVLHAHVVRGSIDGTDFKSQKIPFTRDNQYMIAAYNYSLAEIEERLFCRVLRAKFPKKSDKSRAPEPRVHFALSLVSARPLPLRQSFASLAHEIGTWLGSLLPLCV